MKREIKFRGKDASNGEWVYGNLIIEDDECYISTGFPGIALDEGYWASSYGYPPSSSDFHITNIHEVIPKTVGQFTGLKDKNGVEIYEGDIVIEKSYPMYDNSLCNYRCVVVWDEEKAGFGLEMYAVSNRVRGCAVPYSISEYTELEVIGNIHDNIELIAKIFMITQN